MLKINLLQMKNKAIGGDSPLGSILDSIGMGDVSKEDLIEFQYIAFKAVFIAIGVYLAMYVPDMLLQQRIEELTLELNGLKQETGKLRRELKSKQAIREEMKAITTRENEIKRKLTVISSLDQDRYAAFKVMDAVSLLIPKEVWIKNIDFTASTLKIAGESWEFIPINEFVSYLKQSPLFSDVRLVTIDSRPAQNQVPGVPESLQKIKSFQIEITINRNMSKDKKKA